MRRKVLFLCTHNSCRSQMAEGLVNHFLADGWEAYSAGTEPSSIHPLAIQVMSEIGIDISGHLSKSVDKLPPVDFDLVITLCSDAERECPFYLGKAQRTHIGFDDPAAMAGTDEDIFNAFRRVRDEIKESILTFLNNHN